MLESVNVVWCKTCVRSWTSIIRWFEAIHLSFLLFLLYCIIFIITWIRFFFFFLFLPAHSCVKDGLSGHRRSGRIQSIRAQTPKKQSNADGQAAQRPCRQNPSPTKRQRESGIMVGVLHKGIFMVFANEINRC